MNTDFRRSAGGSKRKLSDRSDSVVQISKKSRMGTESSPICLSESEELDDSEGEKAEDVEEKPASLADHPKTLTDFVADPNALPSGHANPVPISQISCESSCRLHTNEGVSCNAEGRDQMAQLKWKLLKTTLYNAYPDLGPSANFKFLPNANPPAATLTPAFIKANHPPPSESQLITSAVNPRAAAARNVRSPEPSHTQVTSRESPPPISVEPAKSDKNQQIAPAHPSKASSKGGKEPPQNYEEHLPPTIGSPDNAPKKPDPSTSGPTGSNLFQTTWRTIPVSVLPLPLQEFQLGQLGGTLADLPPPETFTLSYSASGLPGPATVQQIDQFPPRKTPTKSRTVERNADAVMQVIKEALALELHAGKHIEQAEMGVQTRSEIEERKDADVNTREAGVADEIEEMEESFGVESRWPEEKLLSETAEHNLQRRMLETKLRDSQERTVRCEKDRADEHAEFVSENRKRKEEREQLDTERKQVDMERKQLQMEKTARRVEEETTERRKEERERQIRQAETKISEYETRIREQEETQKKQKSLIKSRESIIQKHNATIGQALEQRKQLEDDKKKATTTLAGTMKNYMDYSGYNRGLARLNGELERQIREQEKELEEIKTKRRRRTDREVPRPSESS